MQKTVTKKPGTLTFKISAVLIGLSGLFEFTSMTSQTPFFGLLLSAPAVMVYHFIYAVLFIAVGIGVWLARPWGYRILQLTCGIYIVDRLQMAASSETLREYILATLQDMTAKYAQYNLDFSMMTDPALIGQAVWITQVMALTMAACWLGFSVWARWRRAYFE